MKASLELACACAWGWVAQTEEPSKILDRLLAILWRLTHPR